MEVKSKKLKVKTFERLGKSKIKLSVLQLLIKESRTGMLDRCLVIFCILTFALYHTNAHNTQHITPNTQHITHNT